MRRNFARSLSLVLKHEGGWADHPKDPGGATMKGVTISTFRRYVKADGTKADLRNITDAQIQAVYRKQYWDAVRGDELPDGIDYAVFDYAVNSGPTRAIKHLQEVAGVAVDGKLGPATLAAVSALNRAALINALCDRRMKFLKGLETWATFKKGWSARVSGVRSEALAMATTTLPFRDEKPTTIPSIPVRDAPATLERKPTLGNWLAELLAAIIKAFTKGGSK